MATAYHLEALRRQRLIDRAAEARATLEATKLKPQPQPELEGQEDGASRPASAASKTSHISNTGSRASSNQSSRSKASNSSQQEGDQIAQSRGSTAKSTRSKNSSRASVTSGRSAVPPLIAEANETSKHTTPAQSRVSTATHSVHSQLATTRSSQQTSAVQSRSSSAARHTGSKRPRPASADAKAEAVRKDLHEQEVILHDSNLVMGNISMEEEMQLQEMEGSGGAAQGLC